MSAFESSINIHDHGEVLERNKSRIKCSYCGKVVSGSSRLKYHLAGIRGDVVPCELVPENVRVGFKTQILETRGSKVQEKTAGLSREVIQLHQQDLIWKKNHCDGISKKPKCKSAQTSSSASGELTDSASESGNGFDVHTVPQTASVGLQEPDPSSRRAKKSIGRFFFETCTDFSAASSPSFHNLICHASSNGWTKNEIPSVQEFKGWILHDAVKEMHEHVKSIRQSWTSTGCSILLDGWVDSKGRNLVNFIIDSPQGPVYLRSVDISDFINDINALQSLVDGVIQDIGIENVVQIFSFSTTGWTETLGQRFLDTHKSLFWVIDASRCIELMLQKIEMMDGIRQTIDKAKILSRFIHGHASNLKLLRRYTNGHDLIMPSKMHTAMPFLTLENILQQKEKLKAMFCSSAWKASRWASRVEGKRVAKLVGDPSFWKGVVVAMKVTLPLVRVLSLINGAEPQVGFIYETMDQAKETIKEELKGQKYMPFWEVIDEIWNTILHSPIHAAGYYLNPSLFYSADFYGDDEVSFELLCCIVHMIPNQCLQDTISLQLDAYRKSDGIFKEGSSQRTKFSPSKEIIFFTISLTFVWVCVCVCLIDKL